MNVELHIERLVLDGSATDGHARIGASLQLELERLMAWPRSADSAFKAVAIAEIDSGNLETGRAAPADTCGSRIARAIYGRILDV